MAEEQTVSTFTWLNTRLRNNQSVETLVEQTQIRQWHCHGTKVFWKPLPQHFDVTDFRTFRKAEPNQHRSLILFVLRNIVTLFTPMRRMIPIVKVTLNRPPPPQTHWCQLRIRGIGISTWILTFYLVWWLRLIINPEVPGMMRRPLPRWIVHRRHQQMMASGPNLSFNIAQF